MDYADKIRDEQFSGQRAPEPTKQYNDCRTAVKYADKVLAD